MSRAVRRVASLPAVLAVVLLFLTFARSSSGAPPGPAEHPTVRLSYARETGADRCPDESVLREAVSARLGYDPFDERAPTVLAIILRRSGTALEASIELRDRSGRTQGTRQLQGSSADCSELASAMAIAVSLGIDPLSGNPPPPAALPAPAAPAPTPSPPPRVIVLQAPASPLPVSATPRVPVRARVSVGALLAWGVSPAVPAFGGTLGAGLQRGPWSLDLEGRGDWLTRASDGSVAVKSSLALGSLAACVHVSVGMGCAIGGVGSLGATGVVSDRAVFGDAGVRLGVEWPFARPFFLRLFVDTLATLTQLTFHLDGQDVWMTPPLSASVGVAVGVVP